MNTIFNFSCLAKDTKYNFFVVSFLFSLFSFSPLQVKDTTSVNKLDEVLVSAIQLQQKRRSALAI
jgi:iron complex outermembrane receptor protein